MTEQYEAFTAWVRCPMGHGDRKVTVTHDSMEFYCHTCSVRMYGILDYEAYVAACEAENLDPLTQHMWQVHGRPEGPLGPETEFGVPEVQHESS